MVSLLSSSLPVEMKYNEVLCVIRPMPEHLKLADCLRPEFGCFKPGNAYF